jgi:import inner membrane translocase subunit TIM44
MAPKSSTAQGRSIASQQPLSATSLFLRSNFLPHDILFRTSSVYARQFHSHSALRQQAQKQAQENLKDKEQTSEPEGKRSASSEGATEDQGKEGESQEKKAGEEESGEQKEGEGGEKGKKKDAPPPPPHGDKTPWQVFTETLKTEFQASKEWNESTKQLSAGVDDFRQNPTVQKAKSTYTHVADVATTKTADALKTTAKVVGTGAAWTWETAPVKGVRKVANVTGSGIEYVTRPVRKSKAFQAVKETVDDGSSSRYGGWVEKEERRKRRELRELNELERTGRKPSEPMEEDPEYADYDAYQGLMLTFRQCWYQRHAPQGRPIQGDLERIQRSESCHAGSLQHAVRL